MTPTERITCTVNGEAKQVDVDPRKLLVEMLRDDLGCTGTHVGCMTGDCGACTMEVDGKIAKTCLMLAVQAQDADILTVEGLADGDQLSPIQQSFWDEYGFQCGFCLPGQLFAAKDLLETNPSPTEAEIRHALDGNLCRCTGYQFLVAAVAAAAERLRDA
jgi:aerobic carbon-monoxide dehydrogenase small subunit